MKNYLLCVTALLVSLFFAGCSDSPSDSQVDTLSYELSLQSVSPEGVTTVLTYVGTDGQDVYLYVDADDDDESTVVYSGRFKAEAYCPAFKVEQTLADGAAAADGLSVVGLRFTMLLSSYNADSSLIETKEYTFDNVHTVDPTYLPKLFPRTYEYAIVISNGKYTLRRVE